MDMVQFGFIALVVYIAIEALLSVEDRPRSCNHEGMWSEVKIRYILVYSGKIQSVQYQSRCCTKCSIYEERIV